MKRNHVLSAAVVAAIGFGFSAFGASPSRPNACEKGDAARAPEFVANKGGLPDVLLLGDSIRLGYCGQVREKLKGRANVYYPSDNCRYAYYTLRSLYDWQQGVTPDPKKVSVVHWNNGLWDLGQRDARPEPLTPLAEYTNTLVRIFGELRHYYPNARIVFATTTPINPKVFCEQHTLGNAVVERYNAAARAALEPLGVAIDDLYAFCRRNTMDKYRDVVHYTPEGCALQAEEVIRSLPLDGARPAPGEAVRRAPRMDRSKLLIGTYYLKPQAQDEAHVMAMRDCGIDFVFGIDADRRATLDLLEKHGVGCIATGVFPGWGGGNGQFAGQLEKKHPLDAYTQAAKAFADHPAIWMVDIGDEPSALEFPYYSRIIPEIRKYLPKDVTPYLNLYPNYAQVTKNTDAQQLSQLGTATYGEHVDRYAAQIPLDYLSYDFYVYSAAGERFNGFLEKMYDNFETVAASCRKTGRSFWYIPQVNNVFETYRMSPNRLRFQAFTALAYGAEVINWACWMKGWWTHNVVNPDGSVNAYEYLILQTVNRELHALGPDYMRHRNVATHRLGFAGTPKTLDLEGFKGISLAEGGRLVVGEMVARKGAGRAFLAVASDDPHDAGAPRKTLVFRPSRSFKVLRPTTGLCDVKPDADGLVRLPIASAEAILVMAAP